jgi:hypothetical protein
MILQQAKVRSSVLKSESAVLWNDPFWDREEMKKKKKK